MDTYIFLPQIYPTMQGGPLVLGLTGSPLNRQAKHGHYSTSFEQIEKNLDAKVGGLCCHSLSECLMIMRMPLLSALHGLTPGQYLVECQPRCMLVLPFDLQSYLAGSICGQPRAHIRCQLSAKGAEHEVLPPEMGQDPRGFARCADART